MAVNTVVTTGAKDRSEVCQTEKLQEGVLSILTLFHLRML